MYKPFGGILDPFRNLFENTIQDLEAKRQASSRILLRAMWAQRLVKRWNSQEILPDFWTVFVAYQIFFQSAERWTDMTVRHVKKLCPIPRWIHTHADIQSSEHTITTHIGNHALTTPAAAESGGGGPRRTWAYAQIQPWHLRHRNRGNLLPRYGHGVGPRS